MSHVSITLGFIISFNSLSLIVYCVMYSVVI